MQINQIEFLSDSLLVTKFRTMWVMDYLASLLLLLLFAALAWFLIDSMRALEAARMFGRKACNKLDVQFLDDAVARTGIKLERDHRGRRVICRTYHFEFTETGNTRLEGELILLGYQLESLTMEPYQIATEPTLLSE